MTVTPNKDVAEGYINVFLDWESESKQSLMVLEPDGSLLSRTQRNASMGQIDYSDDNQKVEHYVATCSQLVDGVYTIKAAYLEGALPDSGMLTIIVR